MLHSPSFLQTPRAEHEGSHADAFDRAKHERYNDIDPLYDSEDEDTPESKNSFTLAELRQRVNVFTVPPEPNDHGDQKPKLVRYDGRVIRPAVLRPVEPLPPGIGGTVSCISEDVLRDISDRLFPDASFVGRSSERKQCPFTIERARGLKSMARERQDNEGTLSIQVQNNGQQTYSL